MRAMILAAGRGERMGALTATRPKPLLSLGAESLLERQLKRLAAAGIREAVVNLSWHGEQIREAIGDGRRFGLDVAYSQEPEVPLETAGGIVAALPLLGDSPFLLVNGDIVSDFDFAALAVDAARSGDGHGPGQGCLVLVPNPAHHPEGDYGIDKDRCLTLAAPRFTYSGIARLDPSLFAGLAPGRRPLAPVFAAAIGRRALGGVVHSGLWLDVGTPERLESARAALAAGA